MQSNLIRKFLFSQITEFKTDTNAGIPVHKGEKSSPPYYTPNKKHHNMNQHHFKLHRKFRQKLRIFTENEIVGYDRFREEIF